MVSSGDMPWDSRQKSQAVTGPFQQSSNPIAKSTFKAFFFM
jgi:hypothetical protein